MLSASQGHSFEACTDTFIEWLSRRHGTSISPKIRLVDLREHQQGRGVVALEHIDEGEELFTIPYTSTLTVENTLLYTKAYEPLKPLQYWAALTLALICEYGRGQQSPWEPYLQLLPDALDTLMHWSDSELSELQGSTVISKIGKSDADELFETKLWPIASTHRNSFGLLAEMFATPDGKTTFKDLCHRTASIIFAYGFDYDPDFDSDTEVETSDDGQGDSGKIMMVPLADMLNADADLNNAHLVQNTDTVVMTAIRTISAGDQVFNDFGDLPRSDLLRRYGYVTDRYKKYDVVELPLHVIRKAVEETRSTNSDLNQDPDKLFDEADSLEILEDGYDLTAPGDSPEHSVLPSNFVQLLLLLQGNRMALNKMEKATSEEIDLRILSKVADIAGVFKVILRKRFSDYSTTIAEDQDMLVHGVFSRRKRFAIEVRLGEKEILARWLQAVTANDYSQLQHHKEPQQATKKQKMER